MKISVEAEFIYLIDRDYNDPYRRCHGCFTIQSQHVLEMS
jgi:hypothetical protein